MVNAKVDVLALRCLAHLEQEDAMLQASWELVQQTRRALLRRDPGLLRDVLSRQDATASTAQKLRSTRQLLRAEIAAQFAVPDDMASLSYLAARSSPRYRERLLSYQQRLAKTARQVDLLNRGNVALAGQMMDLFRGVLQRLTGENPQPSCYGRSGTWTAPRPSPV